MSVEGRAYPRDLHTDFDIDDPSLSSNFEGVMNELVAKCPVSKSRKGTGYAVINRYKDVRACALDWRTFSSEGGWMLNAPEGNVTILPEDCDPPYHDKWRQVLNPPFSKPSVAKLTEYVREKAAALLDPMVAKGECEFVADFAAKFPGIILFERIFPVPIEDLPQLFDDIDIYSFGPLEERVAAFERVHAYLEQFLRSRHASSPQGDIVDGIVAGVEKHGETCPWEDRVYAALDVVFGGLATTTHAIAAAIFHLAAHPDIRRDLLANPDLVDNAVAETVRLYAPVVAPARTVTRSVEIAGVPFEPGDRIALNLAAASRDPDACANPTKFDLRRDDVVHTAFGVGPHRCLGEHLARLEIKVVIEEFLKRIPDFSLKPGTWPGHTSEQMRSMRDLHLVWPPR